MQNHSKLAKSTCGFRCRSIACVTFARRRLHPRDELLLTFWLAHVVADFLYLLECEVFFVVIILEERYLPRL